MNPRIGFGDTTSNDFASFTILADSNSGMYPTFASRLRTVQDNIVGSDDFEIQIMGFEDARVTLRLDFDSRDDYFKLQAMIGRKRTLVLYAGFTAFKQDARPWQGQDYAFFTNTLLVELVDEMRVGETYATATFIRSSAGMGVSSI